MLLLINSSVLILFLIGKVISEISAYHTHLSSSAYFHLCLYYSKALDTLQESLQCTFTLSEGALLIFLVVWGWKIAGVSGIKPSTFDLSSQSGGFDTSALAMDVKIDWFGWAFSSCFISDFTSAVWILESQKYTITSIQ